jgi:Arm DNA-binding domain/Phage integrase central domain
MAKRKLTDIAVRQAKPSSCSYKRSDGEGLYLLVKPNGTKCWRYDFRYAGKRKTLSIGTYPVITLRVARQALLDAKRLLASNIDPAQEKQRKRRGSNIDEISLFSAMAKEWWEHQKGAWKGEYARRVRGRLQKEILPTLGNRPITEIQPKEIIALVHHIQQRGTYDVASHALQDIRRICHYALQTGQLSTNPAIDLPEALSRPPSGTQKGD